MFNHNGRILFNFGRLHVTGEKTSKLNMSTVQAEALVTLQRTAQKHELLLPLEPGDLPFVNNFAIMHGRERFEDSETQIRHLVRLWLKNQALAWELPPLLERGNRKVYHEKTGDEHYDILPPTRLRFDVQDKFSP